MQESNEKEKENKNKPEDEETAPQMLDAPDGLEASIVDGEDQNKAKEDNIQAKDNNKGEAISICCGLCGMTSKLRKPLKKHMKRVHLTRAVTRGAAQVPQSSHKLTLG